MFATYSNSIELKFEHTIEKMVKNVDKVVKEINKNMKDVMIEIKYIDEILRKRYLAQLQRNFGLIMVLKRDIKITNDELEAENEDYYLYEWDPDIDKKIYRIPKFREKIEKELKKYETILSDFKADMTDPAFKKKKAKYNKKLTEMLAKPNDWYTKIMNDFTKRIGKISPFFDYLDTDERKIIEHFEERISEYQKVLDDLKSRSEFNL